MNELSLQNLKRSTTAVLYGQWESSRSNNPTYLLTYLLTYFTYSLTHSLHGAEHYLKS